MSQVLALAAELQALLLSEQAERLAAASVRQRCAAEWAEAAQLLGAAARSRHDAATLARGGRLAARHHGLGDREASLASDALGCLRMTPTILIEGTRLGLAAGGAAGHAFGGGGGQRRLVAALLGLWGAAMPGAPPLPPAHEAGLQRVLVALVQQHRGEGGAGASVLRRDNLASLAVQEYCRCRAGRYLRAAVLPIVRDIAVYNDVRGQRLSFEVDPVRLSLVDERTQHADGGSLSATSTARLQEQNRHALERYCNRAVDAIREALPSLPREVRGLAEQLHALQPDAAAEQGSILDDLFCHRFVAAALISPEEYGLAPEMPIDIQSRRNLGLLGKALIELAGEKSPTWTVLSEEFVQERQSGPGSLRGTVMSLVEAKGPQQNRAEGEPTAVQRPVKLDLQPPAAGEDAPPLVVDCGGLVELMKLVRDHAAEPHQQLRRLAAAVVDGMGESAQIWEGQYAVLQVAVRCPAMPPDVFGSDGGVDMINMEKRTPTKGMDSADWQEELRCRLDSALLLMQRTCGVTANNLGDLLAAEQRRVEADGDAVRTVAISCARFRLESIAPSDEAMQSLLARSLADVRARRERRRGAEGAACLCELMGSAQRISSVLELSRGCVSAASELQDMHQLRPVLASCLPHVEACAAQLKAPSAACELDSVCLDDDLLICSSCRERAAFKIATVQRCVATISDAVATRLTLTPNMQQSINAWVSARMGNAAIARCACEDVAFGQRLAALSGRFCSFEAFWTALHAPRDATETALACPAHFAAASSWDGMLQSAAVELSRLPSLLDASEMLSCVVATRSLIWSMLALHSTPSADEYLPLMAHVIVLASPPALLSTLHHIKASAIVEENYEKAFLDCVVAAKLLIDEL